MRWSGVVYIYTVVIQVAVAEFNSCWTLLVVSLVFIVLMECHDDIHICLRLTNNSYSQYVLHLSKMSY